MGGDSSTRNEKLRCSYHKDHRHKTENCKTLKLFLERLVKQGYLVEYVKPEGQGAAKARDREYEVAAVQVDRPTAGVIASIYGVVDKSSASKNYLRLRLTRARFCFEAHPIGEVMSISAPKRDRFDKLIYELFFSEKDLTGVDVPHNDALVLMVNVCNFDVKRVLINPGSLSEVMYVNLHEKLRAHIPAKKVRAIDSPIYSFSGEPVWPIYIVEVLVRVGEMVVNVEFLL